MKLSDLNAWVMNLYEEYGDVECFFRDDECFAYRELSDFYSHIATGTRNDVLVIDLLK